MNYSLKRVSDGAGDSGNISTAFWVDDWTNEHYCELNARPRIGVAIRVGSGFARSTMWQDWWQTSYISEILEDKPKYVRFKTESGSIYEWVCSYK